MMAPDYPGAWRIVVLLLVIGALAGVGSWKAYGWLAEHVTLRWDQMP